MSWFVCQLLYQKKITVNLSGAFTALQKAAVSYYDELMENVQLDALMILKKKWFWGKSNKKQAQGHVVDGRYMKFLLVFLAFYQF